MKKSKVEYDLTGMTEDQVEALVVELDTILKKRTKKLYMAAAGIAVLAAGIVITSKLHVKPTEIIEVVSGAGE